MTINSQLSTNEPKKIKERKTMKIKTKQTTKTGTEAETGHHMEGEGRTSVGRRKGGIDGEGTGTKKHNWKALNRWGEVKNGIGNRELRELKCTTHGHELRWGYWTARGCRVEWGSRGKNWENCNSIISKI